MRVKCYFLYNDCFCRVFSIKVKKSEPFPNISKTIGVPVRICHVEDNNIFALTDNWDMLPNAKDQLIPNKYKSIARSLITSFELMESFRLGDISTVIQVANRFIELNKSRLR